MGMRTRCGLRLSSYYQGFCYVLFCVSLPFLLASAFLIYEKWVPGRALWLAIINSNLDSFIHTQSSIEMGSWYIKKKKNPCEVTLKIEMHCFTVLGIRNLRPRCWQGCWFQSESCKGKMAACLSPSFWSLLVIFGIPWPVGASFQSLSFSSCAFSCASVCLWTPLP